MATVYSSRTCIPKFLCSILVGLFTNGILITEAYPHKDLSNPLLQFNNTNSNTTKYDTNPDQDQRAHQHSWKPSRPATKHCKCIWNKPWPGSSITCKGTRNWRKEFQDCPERSKPFNPWRPQLPFSDKANRNLNTKSRNMPPGADVGNTPQPFIRCPLRIYSTTMSGTITTKTGSLEKKWRRSSNKIPTCLTQFPRPIRHRQKNSRGTPSWPWSPRRWPHTCFSNTIMELRDTPTRKISPRGENPFSKRRSEDDNRSKSKESKSESERESKDSKRERENHYILVIMTDSKTKEIKRL